MTPAKISKKQARRLALGSQGLTRKNPFGRGKRAVLACIEQLGYIQIDTISVIERAHHHTIWTRVPGYRKSQLDELELVDRKIFEYWYHAAAYLPMRDYRFCLPYMNAIASGEKHWHAPDKKLMHYVVERIRNEGPLMAKDFAPPKNHKAGDWWSWKPAKRALEQLFIEGKLMVRRRINFHKVYDLPARVLPASLNTSVPTEDEFNRYLVLSTIRAHGIVSEPGISYLRKGIKKSVAQTLARLRSEGKVVRVAIENLPQPFYTTAEQLAGLEGVRVPKRISFLSPFDNAVIQRNRLQQLFGFDYQLECYVPEQKRVYGYFCLPLLYGDDFIGRLDAKADRKTGAFIIRKLYLDEIPQDAGQFLSALRTKLSEMARFNNCRKIHLEATEPSRIVRELSSLRNKGLLGVEN